MKLALEDFCDQGAVTCPVALSRMSADFIRPLTVAEFTEERFSILINRKYMIIDDVLTSLPHQFHLPIVLMPGMRFEVLAKEGLLSGISFEGRRLSATELLTEVSSSDFPWVPKQERVCPVCGDFRFGSYQLPDGTLQRACHGYVNERPCPHRWHESEDEQNGVSTEHDGSTHVVVKGPR